MIHKEIPTNPYAAARVVSTRITPELHKSLRECAAARDCLPSQVIKAALCHYLAMESRPVKGAR